MKIKKSIKYILLITFLFVLKVNAVYAEDITCVYEMPAINYSYKKGELKAHDQNNGSSIERITVVVSSKKNYTITVNSTLGKSWKDTSSFKDKNFVKNVLKSGCPSYVRRTQGNFVIINENEFNEEMDEFYTYFGKKHPMALASQNGKPAEPINYVVSKAANNWIKLNEQSKDDPSIQKLKNDFIESVKKSSVYESKLSKNTKLNNLMNIEQWEKESIEKENALNNAKNDYCSVYCSATYCKDQTDETAKTSCVNSCNTSIKPKCDAAYNSCKSIQDESEKTQCLNTAFESNGLDKSYFNDRNKEISKMEQDLKNFKNMVSNASVSGLKITIGEGYKVKCDDVVMLHDLWVIMVIAAPALVVLFGTFDFLKAIIAGDQEKMKKAWSKFPKRLLALVFLILIPQIIGIIVSISNHETASDTSLVRCIIKGGE